jgi:hypothetical protein
LLYKRICVSILFFTQEVLWLQKRKTPLCQLAEVRNSPSRPEEVLQPRAGPSITKLREVNLRPPPSQAPGIKVSVLGLKDGQVNVARLLVNDGAASNGKT